MADDNLLPMAKKRISKDLATLLPNYRDLHQISKSTFRNYYLEGSKSRLIDVEPRKDISVTNRLSAQNYWNNYKGVNVVDNKKVNQQMGKGDSEHRRHAIIYIFKFIYGCPEKNH